jgi:hypothetical protein
MSDRRQKQIRKIVQSGFKEDFTFFVDTLKSWPFLKRLKFCKDVMLKRI